MQTARMSVSGNRKPSRPVVKPMTRAEKVQQLKSRREELLQRKKVLQLDMEQVERELGTIEGQLEIHASLLE